MVLRKEILGGNKVRHLLRVTLMALALLMALVASSLAQKTTGAIDGTVTDSSGAAIPSANILVVSESTGEGREISGGSDGKFHVLEVEPGYYTVTIEVSGFKRERFDHFVVLIAQVSPLNAKLQVGEVQQELTVMAGNEVQVDTVSTEVGSVITQTQIEQLAIVGRSVMDLAQLAPGVQLRDGGEIDPTKNNFTIAAFQGRGGRETQVEWDGLSIQDHTVGGPVQNVGLDAIQEFQVAEATLSPAQSVASGGAVNMVSRSGGNDLHGSAWEFFRDSRMGANIGPSGSPYDRNQLGGRVGDALLKDRLFFFADYELTDTRDSFFGNPPCCASLDGFYSKPFREQFMMGRIDYKISSHWTAFSRYSYTFNHGVVGTPFLGGSRIDGFNNRTQSRVFGGGFNFAGSSWVHSFKFGYNAYAEDLVPDRNLPVPVDSLGRTYTLQIDNGSSLSYGPNTLTNQFEREKNYQVKYDAGRVLGHHSLAFGADLSKWSMGLNFPLFINAPALESFSFLDPGDPNPQHYPLVFALLGNGLGYTSEKPGVGLPFGAFFQWRPAGYIHDTWQLPHHLTINFGLRYVYMNGQFNQDFNRPTALLAQFNPAYGRNTHTPAYDFGPQAGLAWDPTGSGKTVIRAAAGLYYEELTYDSFYPDRTAFISSGIGLQIAALVDGLPLIDPRSGQPFSAGDPLAVQYGFPSGTSAAALSPLFFQPIGSVSKDIVNANLLLQAASAQNSANPNAPSLFATSHQISWSAQGIAAFAPGVKNPRVFQFNVGVQHQLMKGLVFSGNYVRVQGMDFPLIIDENHVGEAVVSSFNKSAAVAAIAAGNMSVGCPADAQPSSINCAIGKGATMGTYGSFGLGAGPAFQGFAFQGRNPNFGVMDFFQPRGRNTYNGMNLRLDGQLGAPGESWLQWMRSNVITVAYTLSRNTGNIRPYSPTVSTEPTLNTLTWDNANPTGISGPNGLDRTHMLNIGTITELKFGFRFSQITHWFSPLAQTTLIPSSFSYDPTTGATGSGCGGGAAEIFCSDVTGDGTVNDILPTAGGPGAYGRSLKHASGLNGAIAAYNSKYAGQPTPAGALLISQSLFSLTQLQQLNGVMPTIPLAPPDQVGLDPLVLTDVRISWHHKFFGEKLEVEPSWDAFNIFNRTGFDPPGNILNANLTGTQDSINGTTPANRANVRQRGSGTFEQGARRQMQAGLRLTF